MGHCTSNIYQTAKRQYGELFQKLVVQQQSLVKFKEYVRGKEQQYDSKQAAKTLSFHKEIDQRNQLLTNNIAQAKLNLDAQLPYGISSYEQMTKTSIDNLYGVQGYRKKISEASNQIDIESDENKKSFHSKAEQIIKKVEQQLKIDSEKLKPFHDLPQQKKKFIYDKGVKQFQGLIKTKLGQLQSLHANQLNPDIYMEKLNNIVSLDSLDNIVNISKANFRNQNVKIIGNNLDSKIRI